MTQSYGSRVRQLRKQRGWTQRQLAEASTVPSRTIQDVERKATPPQVGTREKLEKALPGLADAPMESGESCPRHNWSDDATTAAMIVGAWLTALPERDRQAEISAIVQRVARPR